MIRMRSDTTSGNIMPNDTLPDWERVLLAAAHLQNILPEAVLVGGAASAIYAGHRISIDADHVLTDLRNRFDEVLAQLESVVGWKTARIKRPVQILGSLDGIDTGVRQLIREEPLESTRVDHAGRKINVPTPAEILRIKAVLVLKRNATRDYIDFAALAHGIGEDRVVEALLPFDRLYPQPANQSALQQLQIQLANPMPFDLEETRLPEYKHLAPQWHDWQSIKDVCVSASILIFDRVLPALKPKRHTPGGPIR